MLSKGSRHSEYISKFIVSLVDIIKGKGILKWTTRYVEESRGFWALQ